MINIISSDFWDIEARIRIRGNEANISFPGSDKARDVLNVFMFWPHKNNLGHTLHKGAYFSVVSIFWEAMRALPPDIQTFRISGHSLGGAQAQAFTYFLLIKLRASGWTGRKVVLHTDGAIKALGKSAVESMMGNIEAAGIEFEATHAVYGNDPIPLLYPWFQYPGETIILKKRSFPWIDLNLTGGDHVKGLGNN